MNEGAGIDDSSSMDLKSGSPVKWFAALPKG